MSQVLFAGRYMLRRMLRDVPGMIVGLVVPLVLIPIFGLVFSWVPKDIPYLRGVGSPTAFFAAGFLVMFQLFGGNYSFGFARSSILGPMGWRVRSLPCESGAILLGIVASSTLVCFGEGILVVALTRLALGVRWGSPLAVAAVLLGISLLSQLAYLDLLMALRDAKAASSLGWLFSYGSAILGGLIIPFPADKPFFSFLMTYGGPYSLAQTALREAASPSGSPAKAALCVGILFLASAALAAAALPLAKRKLA